LSTDHKPFQLWRLLISTDLLDGTVTASKDNVSLTLVESVCGENEPTINFRCCYSHEQTIRLAEQFEHVAAKLRKAVELGQGLKPEGGTP
jgi:hypothetical protein